MIRASIDLGTNTCLLLIAEWDEKRNELTRIVSDDSTVVRLGEGVDQSRLLQSIPMNRVLACLQNYVYKVKAANLSPQEVLCVATSQARDAKNSEEFFLRVKQETGFEFLTLSGDEEARYTFLGALLPGMDPAQTAVIDIGGGSTEITTLDWAQSVDIGSVRLTERCFKSTFAVPDAPVITDEFKACEQLIDGALRVFLGRLNASPKTYQLVAVAGTATSLAAWHLNLDKFDANTIDQSWLTQESLFEMVQKLKSFTLVETRKIPLMDPKRADVILAGSMILWRAMRLLDFKECRVSSRGLRFGVLQGLARI